MNADQIEFQAKMADFYKLNPSISYLIRKNPEPAERREMDRVRDEWFTYMHVNRHFETLKFWQFILQKNGSKYGLQVPCKTPERFDMGYQAPANILDWSVKEPQPSARRDISGVRDRTIESLKAARPYGKQPPEVAPVKKQTFDEWQADFKKLPPPSVSDEFRRKMNDRG